MRGVHRAKKPESTEFLGHILPFTATSSRSYGPSPSFIGAASCSARRRLTGVRIPLGSFTFENDTEHMGCSEQCRRQQQGTRVAARGSSVLRDASGVMSGVTPDLGRLETTGRSERSRCGLPIRNRVAGISIRRFYSTTRRMVTFSTRSSTRLRFDRPDTDQVPHRRAEAPTATEVRRDVQRTRRRYVKRFCGPLKQYSTWRWAQT